MQADFKLQDVIYLVKGEYELDLHNDFAFEGVCYSVAERQASLKWKHLTDERVDANSPTAVRIEFFEVAEFRFLPRDKEMPFTEDNCLSEVGYWTDEDWCEGVMVTNEASEPDWLTAFGFMSGAIIAIQAARATAVIVAN